MPVSGTLKTREIVVGIAYNAYDPLTARKVERASEESVREMADEVLAAVTELGYTAFTLPLHKSFPGFLDRLKDRSADVLINLCEAFAGNTHLESNVAAVFELLGLGFTGSDSRTLALCLNKFRAKAVLQAYGLPTAPAQLMDSPEAKLGLPFPVIVKPNREDASLGILPESVCHDRASLRKRIRHIRDVFDQPALVEEYIDGREFNVAVFDHAEPEALPVSEIDFSRMPEGQPRILSYEAKWLADGILYQASPPICPAPIAAAVKSKLQNLAVRAFRAVGCRDYGRVDFRMDKKGGIFVLEVNPNPDISLNAGYARGLAAAGIAYKDFWGRLIEKALARRSKK
jgi:D-alanine-D-alanine ligase